MYLCCGWFTVVCDLVRIRKEKLMGDNTTFVNMDEVRGWGVRAMREVYGKSIDKKMTKETLKIMAGTGLFFFGLGLITNGFENYGFWHGVERMASKDMHKAYLDDAIEQGYKLASK
jgi:hypothetical protein